MRIHCRRKQRRVGSRSCKHRVRRLASQREILQPRVRIRCIYVYHLPVGGHLLQGHAPLMISPVAFNESHKARSRTCGARDTGAGAMRGATCIRILESCTNRMIVLKDRIAGGVDVMITEWRKLRYSVYV